MADVAATTIVILAEMRAFLNVPTAQTGKDDLIIDLLDSYNTEIEEYLGVTLINSTYTESYDGDDTNVLFLKHYPIASVTTLTIDSTAKTENTDFFVYKAEGYIKLDDDTFSSTDLQNVDIVYVAGHGAARANVSKVLKNALKTWVSRIWKAENIDFSTNFDNSNMGYLRSQMMPWDIKQKLDYFRCRRFGRIS
jgi:uncharacterized phiE125 gp8 family phage protein